MVRPKKKRIVNACPPVPYFKPAGVPLCTLEEEVLALEEVEALRLVELEDMDQAAAAEKMGVSQPTLTRVLSAARQKLARAICHGEAIRIKGGEYQMFGRGAGRGRGQGQGRGRKGGDFAAGPGGTCVCTNPDCEHEATHQAGQPCYQQKCPECGSPMVRKR